MHLAFGSLLEGPKASPSGKVGLKSRPKESPHGLNSKWAEQGMGPNIKRPLVSGLENWGPGGGSLNMYVFISNLKRRFWSLLETAVSNWSRTLTRKNYGPPFKSLPRPHQAPFQKRPSSDVCAWPPHTRKIILPFAFCWLLLASTHIGTRFTVLPCEWWCLGNVCVAIK